MSTTNSAGYDAGTSMHPAISDEMDPREAQAEPSDIERAKKILARLCDRGLLSMSIPVRQDDEDMVFSRVIALAASVPVSAQEPSDEAFDDLFLASGLHAVAHATPQNLAMLRGLCWSTLERFGQASPKLYATDRAPEAPQGAPGEAVIGYPGSVTFADLGIPDAPESWDEEHREDWRRLQVAERNKMLWRAYALKLRSTHPPKQAEGVMPGAWISVEDRLPEPDVEVLCAGQGWGNPFVTACRYDDEREGWWQIGSDYSDAHDGQQYPTHWMPLPEAPRAALQSTDQKGAGE